MRKTAFRGAMKASVSAAALWLAAGLLLCAGVGLPASAQPAAESTATPPSSALPQQAAAPAAPNQAGQNDSNAAMPATKPATPEAPEPAGPSRQLPAAPSGSPSNAPPRSATAIAPSRPKVSARQRARAEKLYLNGVRAVQRGDAAAAEQAFSQAAQADPSNSEYEIDRKVARSQAAMALIHRADASRIKGDPRAASAQLQRALAIDPGDPEVAQHAAELPISPTGLPLNGATLTLAPEIRLSPNAGKRSFHFRGTEQEVMRRVLTAYGLTPSFDSSVGAQQISFDADNVDFAQASKMVQMATGSFLVPLDPKRVLVAKDTRLNRNRYERLSEETVRLPGLNQSEMTDMGNIARNVFDIQHANVQPTARTISLRAPGGVLTALNRTFANLLQGNGEVLLEVKIFQLAQTNSRNLGVQLPQTVTLFNVPSELNSIIQQNPSLVQQIISSGLANAGDYAAIAAILIASGQVSNSILGQPFALFGGGLTESGVSLPAVTANIALNSSDTRALDQIQLRLADSQQGTIRSGSRYPIETSSYSSLAGSSPNIPGLTSAGLSSALAGLGVNLNSLTSAETIPQVQYQDLGMTLTATPKIEGSGNIALNLSLKITALQGTSLNGLPVLTNQSYTANVIVGHGASALLLSEMTRQESKAVSGAPGLSSLPGFQSSTNNQRQLNTSKLVILITPHLLRRGHDETAGPYISLPLGGANPTGR